MPGFTGVAVFDTAFHPDHAAEGYLYGVPYEITTSACTCATLRLHGTSHRYVKASACVCEFLGLDRSKTRVITCHLGNGTALHGRRGLRQVRGHQHGHHATGGILRWAPARGSMDPPWCELHHM